MILQHKCLVFLKPSLHYLSEPGLCYDESVECAEFARQGSALTEKCTNMPTTVNTHVLFVVRVIYRLQGKCTRSVQTEKCTNMLTTVNILVHSLVGSDKRSALKSVLYETS